MKFNKIIAPILIVLIFTFTPAVFGSNNSGASEEYGVAFVFLTIALILIAAKLSSLIERYKQPAVLGELVVGVILGNLGLFGIHFFSSVAGNEIIRFLAELGVVVLLFQIGLESNIEKMKAVGLRALLVATVGVVAPFVLGTYVVGPILLPGLTSHAYLFLGAALTATSVGITARVFKDLRKLNMPEAQIVLGAAVIDDVMGLIILAVVSAVVTAGTVSLGAIGIITGKALLFLIGAILLGQKIAPILGRKLSSVNNNVATKFTLAISFGLILAWLAGAIGLAPIVGAFAAGLVLDPVHFRFFESSKVFDALRGVVKDVDEKTGKKISEAIEPFEHRHVEELIEPLGHFLVPIFFVVTGMGVNLKTFLDPKIIFTALGITVVAFVGKIIAGMVAGNVKKWVVGWGMVPRGEVGLIFAAIGKSLGVVNDEIYSVIVIMVIVTTLVTPVILTFLLNGESETK